MTSLVHRPGASRVLVHAAAGKANLAVFATVVALASLSGHFGLIAAGGLLYMLLVLHDVLSPHFWRRVFKMEAEARRQLPDHSQLADEGLRGVVSSLHEGYAEIARVVRMTPPPIKAHVRTALASLDDLRAQAAQLVRNADELSRYLRAVPRDPVDKDIQRLTESLDKADAAARSEFERAIAIRTDQLAALDHMKRERDRMFAALQFIVVAVEAFPARIYRLRSLESSAKEELMNDIHAQLARMDLDICSTQRLLESCGEAPRAAVEEEGG